jgi:hypothetical protein
MGISGVADGVVVFVAVGDGFVGEAVAKIVTIAVGGRGVDVLVGGVVSETVGVSVGAGVVVQAVKRRASKNKNLDFMDFYYSVTGGVCG